MILCGSCFCHLVYISGKSRFGRVKMNTVQVTLSMYYKIVVLTLYGGLESRGYAMIVI